MTPRTLRPFFLRKNSQGTLTHDKKDNNMTTNATTHLSLYAFYVAGKQPALIVSQEKRPVGVTYPVKGKKEARTLAAEKGAQPWNF